MKRRRRHSRRRANYMAFRCECPRQAEYGTEAALGIIQEVKLESGTNASHHSQAAFGVLEQQLRLAPYSAAAMSLIATPGIWSGCVLPRSRADSLTLVNVVSRARA
eukprot:6116813-Heterocapsa_arctica.AAC.1